MWDRVVLTYDTDADLEALLTVYTYSLHAEFYQNMLSTEIKNWSRILWCQPKNIFHKYEILNSVKLEKDCTCMVHLLLSDDSEGLLNFIQFLNLTLQIASFVTLDFLRNASHKEASGTFLCWIPTKEFKPSVVTLIFSPACCQFYRKKLLTLYPEKFASRKFRYYPLVK